jgi:hypothetical protein
MNWKAHFDKLESGYAIEWFSWERFHKALLQCLDLSSFHLEKRGCDERWVGASSLLACKLLLIPPRWRCPPIKEWNW